MRGRCGLMAAVRAIQALQRVGQKRDVISAVCGRKFTKFCGYVADPSEFKNTFLHLSSTCRFEDIRALVATLL